MTDDRFCSLGRKWRIMVDGSLMTYIVGRIGRTREVFVIGFCKVNDKLSGNIMEETTVIIKLIVTLFAHSCFNPQKFQ